MNISEKIALMSIIVALLSIALTIITICQTRKHNRLSVKPLFKIIPYDAENYIAVMILNAGTGPLIRKTLKISNGQISGSNLIDLMPSNENIRWSNFSKFTEFIISPNQYETLLEIKGNENDNDFNEYKNQIRKALKDITIECDYNDIYGKNYKSGIVALDYCYGRHFK